jgi:hypothetical protein
VPKVGIAYDDGTRLLAASQANDVALESEKLKQGLLTYTLVGTGLKGAILTGLEGGSLCGWTFSRTQRRRPLGGDHARFG